MPKTQYFSFGNNVLRGWSDFFFLLFKRIWKGLEQCATYNSQNADGEEEVVDTAPKTEECPLNGELFSKARKKLWETRRPLGVAIENHLESRPQSGLSKADVVYEAGS